MSNNGQFDTAEAARTLSVHLRDLTRRITAYLNHILHPNMGFVIVLWPEGEPDSILTITNSVVEENVRTAIAAAKDEYDEDAQNIITPDDAPNNPNLGGDDDE